MSSRHGEPQAGAKASADIIAGAGAGGVSRVLVAPLDLIKIRLQLPGGPHVTNTGTSLHETVRLIYAEEGLRTFWRGNVPAMCLWMSYSAVQFSCFHGLKRLLVDEAYGSQYHGDKLKYVYDLLNGAVAGTAATVITYPFDLMRTTFAAQGLPREHPTMIHLWRARIAKSGVLGLYRGCGAAVAGIAPFMGLNFCIFEALSARKCWDTDAAAVLSPMWLGTISGTTAKLAVYPLDTVKKRMQVQGQPLRRVNGSRPVLQPHYSSTWQCCRHILRAEGLIGFYRGTLPTLLKAGLGTGATFASFDYIRSRLM